MRISAMVPIIVGATAVASAESLKTRSLSLGIHDGVVTAFTDLRTGDTYVEKITPPLTGLRRLKGRDLWNHKATVRTTRDADGATCVAVWREDAGESRVTTRITPQPDGDVLITQQAGSASPGLVGVQWGLVVPDAWDVLVPGHSGLRFGADTACERRQFDYPMSWEAQFVLLQAERGGMLIYALDNAERYKALHVEQQKGRFLIGLETRCTAPFEPVTKTTSVRWRVHAYQGDWRVGAGVYRRWAAETFGLTEITARRPGWVKDIQFVVIAGLDEKLLKALAGQVEPRRTLIYVPAWRRDGYDRNYPDYTPKDGFADRMKRARAMGSRVMLHVNYFGVTPENAHYAKMKPYHCVDPFTRDRLYWDWQRARPPIKFAYINPAAAAWRELFVRLMVDLCGRLEPDALHLDQTLCAFNDGNGLIDGRNMMQGNIALHRELRRALPEVALSGEGLNEITCRHEAFAQRHVYGINHSDQDWNDALIATAHPVSSALLTPYVTLYGYLGMTNPAPHDYYFAWRKAYERFGVIPTLARPSIEQLTEPPPVVRVLLDEARWFQRHLPVPDFASPWGPDTLFAYRTSDGGRAEYRRDADGVALVVTKPKTHVVSRRITGATSIRLPGRAPDWRAYDEQRLLGLDPACSYVYVDEPRDLTAFHVRALPSTARVRRIGLRPEFATLCLDDRRSVVADLWQFDGPTRCGERLRDGTIHQTDGDTFESQAGTRICPQGEGIFAHPPWREQRTKAKGETQSPNPRAAWIEFDIQLPADKPARFDAGVGLRTKHAEENSDGVTFRVTVRDREGRSDALAASRHSKRTIPEPVRVDLAALRGRSVTVRLETDPGPAGSVSFDWALWTRPRIVLTEAYAAPVEVVSPRDIVGVISSCDGRTPMRRDANRYTLTLAMPGTTYLLFTEPRRVDPPAALWQLPFSQELVTSDGRREPPHGFLQARAQASVIGGVSRDGLFAHPPSRGQMHVDWLIELPAQPVKLTGFAGIRDGAEEGCRGVGFRIVVNGRQAWHRDLQPDGKWRAFDVSLASHAGQTIVLTLVTDALGDYTCDWAQWGEPRLVPAD